MDKQPKVKREVMLGKYLTEKEISQEELARRINKSWRSVSQWCTGKSVPKVDAVILMAKALELSIPQVCELLGFDVSGLTGEKETTK